jgi:polar amino acid transport system permease protein
MDFSFITRFYPMFISGTLQTLSVSFVAVIVGFFAGLLVCLVKMSKNKILNFLATVYVEIIRGTPLLVQIYIVYFGLPQLGINFSAFTAATLTLSINSGAYIAEIFRSGIQAVDKGQTEASRSLGLSSAKTMRYIIIPQAVKNILPTLANEFITLIKESSIISVIGTREIMFSAMMIKNSLYRALEPLIVAAAIYFVLTFTLSKLVGILEKKLSVSN